MRGRRPEPRPAQTRTNSRTGVRPGTPTSAVIHTARTSHNRARCDPARRDFTATHLHRRREVGPGIPTRPGSISAHQDRSGGNPPWGGTPARRAGRTGCVTEAAIAAIEGFQAGYVTIAGLPTWHEVGGEGPAVVLLHGGFSGAASWGAQAPALASAGFRVHVPERRGHAHTPDVDGPLTYEVMAADTVAYLEAEVGGRAHLVGWSDGAVVALLVALRRPDLGHLGVGARGDLVVLAAEHEADLVAHLAASPVNRTVRGGCLAATLTGCCAVRKRRNSSGRLMTRYHRMGLSISRLSTPRR